jgi:pectinesterase
MKQKTFSLFTALFFLLISINLRGGIKPDFVVAKDGSGDFKTVQQAIDAVPDFRKKVTTIFIKNGIYKEKLILPASQNFVKFIGENADSTILNL